MGPNTSVEFRVMLYSQDGENYSVMPGVLSNIVVDNVVTLGETDYTRKLKLFHEPVSFTANIKFPHKKITRKTFKKWLMHFPWADRDLAECWCYIIGLSKGRVSYARTYRDMFFDQTYFGMLNSIGNQLKETEKHG